MSTDWELARSIGRLSLRSRDTRLRNISSLCIFTHVDRSRGITGRVHCSKQELTATSVQTTYTPCCAMSKTKLAKLPTPLLPCFGERTLNPRRPGPQIVMDLGPITSRKDLEINNSDSSRWTAVSGTLAQTHRRESTMQRVRITFMALHEGQGRAWACETIEALPAYITNFALIP